MAETFVLETPRLRLRPIELADAVAIQAIASQPEVADTMVSIPHPYPDNEAAQYVATQRLAATTGKVLTLAIMAKQRSSFLGVAEIRDIEPEHAQAELSFWISPKVWGQGFMSEALRPLLAIGFEQLGLNRLYAYHMVRNPGSGRVLEKSGFTLEGVLRQRVQKNGIFEDVKLWSILCQELLVESR